MLMGTLVLYLESFLDDCYKSYIKRCNKENVKTILNKEEFRMVFEHIEEQIGDASEED
tara:strand:+ start:78 stop:251 length:174 start_codon:yes stop_codon:yes gene_type:complete